MAYFFKFNHNFRSDSGKLFICFRDIHIYDNHIKQFSDKQNKQWPELGSYVLSTFPEEIDI